MDNLMAPLQLAFALISTIAPDGGHTAFRQPQLAVDGDFVAVAFGSGDAVHFAASENRGVTFSPAIRVNREDGKIMLGRHRGPRIAISGGSVVISAIFRETGDLMSWRSGDRGKTWSPAVRANDTGSAAREGLHAMAAGAGLVYVTWLDLRVKGMRLYGSLSKDGGKTWSRNALVYKSPGGHICECCHPSVKISQRGKIFAMWRNALGGARDMYVASSTDQGQSFAPARKLGTGTWILNACPMDGGDLAIVDGKVWSAWRRENKVILAAPDGKETVLGEGKDPAIAAAGGRVAVVWTGTGGKLWISDGVKPPAVLDEAGAFVHLTGGKQAYAAWESGHAFKVTRLE